ncbi:MAG TPA: hypothetical protein VFE35_03140 [Candidatus Cybelea sp.]|jgi:hypothetical protein|nr:hypothetical protein [Candidatus Cybelea sp.]
MRIRARGWQKNHGSKDLLGDVDITLATHEPGAGEYYERGTVHLSRLRGDNDEVTGIRLRVGPAQWSGGAEYLISVDLSLNEIEFLFAQGHHERLDVIRRLATYERVGRRAASRRGSAA